MAGRRANVRLWWEVARRGFQRQSTYRAATAAGIFTNSIFGFVKVAILLAVYRQRAQIAGFDAVDAVTFSWVAQGFFAVLFSGVGDLANRVSTGEVVVDLYRPVDFQRWTIAGDLGRMAYLAAVRGVVPVLVGATFYDLRLPPTPGTWPAFAASVVLAMLVASSWWFLVSVSAFWLLNADGPMQVASIVLLFFSGLLLPLWMFPDWLEPLARLAPPAAMLQLPVEVFLGRHNGASLVAVLGFQLFWLGALYGLGHLLLVRAMRKVVIQGG